MWLQAPPQEAGTSPTSPINGEDRDAPQTERDIFTKTNGCRTVRDGYENAWTDGSLPTDDMDQPYYSTETEAEVNLYWNYREKAKFKAASSKRKGTREISLLVDRKRLLGKPGTRF